MKHISKLSNLMEEQVKNIYVLLHTDPRDSELSSGIPAQNIRMNHRKGKTPLPKVKANAT